MPTKRTYTTEFKQETVRLAEQHGYAQASRDLDVHPSLIRKWKKRLEEVKGNGQRAFPGRGNPRDEELACLKRENTRLQQENEILKNRPSALLLPVCTETLLVVPCA